MYVITRGVRLTFREDRALSSLRRFGQGPSWSQGPSLQSVRVQASVPLQVGVCVPDSCGNSEVELASILAIPQILSFSKKLGITADVKVVSAKCEEKEELSTGGKVMMYINFSDISEHNYHCNLAGHFHKVVDCQYYEHPNEYSRHSWGIHRDFLASRERVSRRKRTKCQTLLLYEIWYFLDYFTL
ncbi:hypothetical protein FSP39_015121 [Pinctada imbricata]|uniref:Uncharacterized protein n=1 Tax=Pinctada imbricata TaxID=66713 RepID=A0AA89CC57_PINIB|nr:hypothetical protein FSP39_015121 [Pinctada imbricata]